MVFNDEVIEISDVAYITNAMMVDLEWFCDLIDAETKRYGSNITIKWQAIDLLFHTLLNCHPLKN